MLDITAHNVRLFHFGTRLPVFLINGQEAASLPSDSLRACLLLGEPRALKEELRLDQAPVKELFFPTTPYLEQYFCFKLTDETALACGPYLHASTRDNHVSQLIRSLQLQVVRKDELARYFKGLSRLSDSSIYYASSLLRSLILGPEGSPQAKAPALVSPVSPQLYEQTAYQRRMSMFHHPPYFLEQEISRQIAAGNRENAMQLLGELRTLEPAKLAETPLRSMKNSMVAFVTFITRAAMDGGVPYQEAFTLSDGFIQLIERQQDIAMLETIMEAIINRFIDQVKQVRNLNYSKPVRQVLAHIDEYLTEDLNREALGKAFFMHPDYLATLFHQEVGETLHQFIQRRRIEEAARFMRYSSESISAIATFYRFSSQSHFTAVFKKYMNMTPGQYRGL